MRMSGVICDGATKLPTTSRNLKDSYLCRMQDAVHGLAALCSLKQLRSLSIRHHVTLSPEAAQALASLTAICELSMWARSLCGAELTRLLAGLPRLETLRLDCSAPNFSPK